MSTITIPTVPLTLIQAIAKEEGYYSADPNARPRRNLNPGDLEYHPWMAEFGATGGDPRFAIFPSEEQGFACLRRLLQFSAYKGKTIAQAIATFAPGNENDTAAYVRNVAAWTEQQPDTVIDGILG
jgi:hypothetical protein